MRQITLLIITALLILGCEQQSNEKAKAKKKLIDAVGVDTVQPTTTDTDDTGTEQVEQTPVRTPEAPQVQQTPEAQEEEEEDDDGAGDDDDTPKPFTWEANKAEYLQFLDDEMLTKGKIDALDTNTLASTQLKAHCSDSMGNFLGTKRISSTSALRTEGIAICETYIDTVAFGDKIIEAKVTHNYLKLMQAELEALKLRVDEAKKTAPKTPATQTLENLLSRAEDVFPG